MTPLAVYAEGATDRESQETGLSSHRRPLTGPISEGPLVDGVCPGSWHHRAACLGLDSDLFFVERGEWGKAQIALAACKSCPVRLECLSESLDADGWADAGIFGGTTPKDRRKLRTARRVGDDVEELAATLTFRKRMEFRRPPPAPMWDDEQLTTDDYELVL